LIYIYSFAAQNNEELSFVKGERLEILDRPPADPDWYRARNTNGSIGLIPKNYVQVKTIIIFLFENVFITFCIYQEISDYLTEPFRPRVGGTNGGGGGPSSALPMAPNNVIENFERLNVNPASSTSGVSGNQAIDPSFPHLREKAWFYGAITRADCDNLLNQYGQDGDFLVRSSETNIGDYSVSLKAPGRNKHFRVHVEGALYVIGQRRYTNY